MPLPSSHAASGALGRSWNSSRLPTRIKGQSRWTRQARATTHVRALSPLGARLPRGRCCHGKIIQFPVPANDDRLCVFIAEGFAMNTSVKTQWRMWVVGGLSLLGKAIGEIGRPHV